MRRDGWRSSLQPRPRAASRGLRPRACARGRARVRELPASRAPALLPAIRPRPRGAGWQPNVLPAPGSDGHHLAGAPLGHAGAGAATGVDGAGLTLCDDCGKQALRRAAARQGERAADAVASVGVLRAPSGLPDLASGALRPGHLGSLRGARRLAAGACDRAGGAGRRHPPRGQRRHRLGRRGGKGGARGGRSREQLREEAAGC